MGRTPLTLGRYLGLAVAGLVWLGLPVLAASAATTVHHKAKTKAKRCRATRHHSCPRRKPPAPIRPAASTGQARAVSSGSATLTAVLTIRSRSATYWFQYGATSAYGNQTTARPVRPARRLPVSTAVGGLVAGLPYHYRIVASSCNGCAAGTAYGADVTFIAGGYSDPVFAPFAAADPFVLDNNGAHDDYWAFTTGGRFPMLHSSDLVHWTDAGAAMPQRPSWVIQTGDWHPWGPSVLQVPGPCPGSGSTSCYVMYYTGVSAAFHVNCVAVATATAPGGPYTDQGPLSDGTLDAAGRPLGCGDALGSGMIDPSPFRDPSGQVYLYVSEDSTCSASAVTCTGANAHRQATISAIPLAPAGLTAAGPRTPLFSGDPGTWENADEFVPVVEGPFMVDRNGTYYLFYSGGNWRYAYGMGYATATSPTGPFAKSPSNPILSQTDAVYSPGGGDEPVIGPHGGTWLIYHGREGSYLQQRLLRIEPLSWRSQDGQSDAPVLGQPTDAPQAFAP